MAKLNGTARWVMAIIAAVSLTFGICSWAFYADLKPKVETLQGVQGEDHTELQLLKQTINRIDKTVQEIRQLLYQPRINIDHDAFLTEEEFMQKYPHGKITLN